MLPPAPEVVPPLQPPGAGLPWPERWVARLLVGRQARQATRAGSEALFAREREIIMEVVGAGGPSANGRRTLVRRLPGMEDSSRYWSVYMTLDHLRIVNLGAAELIRLLGSGRTPARVTGTAEVKPSPDVDDAVVGEFVRACDHFERSVAEVGNLRTALRWPHPWFGPLDAAEWHFFTAFHLGLHRRQIEAIRRTQPAGA